MALLSSAVSRKPSLGFLLNCFVQEIKGFYQSSLGNEVDFRDIVNVFPNILTKNLNFKKLRHDFADERAVITTTLISSCHWKTPNFLLVKENSELSQIRTEKQIIPFKTTVNELFNDIYLAIGCFDWKIGVFQQTVLRGLLYAQRQTLELDDLTVLRCFRVIFSLKKENYPIYDFTQFFLSTKKISKVVNFPLTNEKLCLSFWHHKQEKWLFQFSKLSSSSYVSL